MIETSFKIEDTLALQDSAFQKEIFNHWLEILGDQRFPDQRDFRPQKFPKYLPQIAIISVTNAHDYIDRLVGDTILEVLQLRHNKGQLVEPQDTKTRDMVHSMLNETRLAQTPMFYKGKFERVGNKPIDFTALVLPFCQTRAPGVLDTMMLAFDFSKHNHRELDFTTFTADHT